MARAPCPRRSATRVRARPSTARTRARGTRHPRTASARRTKAGAARDAFLTRRARARRRAHLQVHEARLKSHAALELLAACARLALELLAGRDGLIVPHVERLLRHADVAVDSEHEVRVFKLSSAAAAALQRWMDVTRKLHANSDLCLVLPLPPSPLALVCVARACRAQGGGRDVSGASHAFAAITPGMACYRHVVLAYLLLVAADAQCSTVSTLAGSTTSGSANGQGAAASFKAPSSVAVAADGTVFVGDRGNNMVRAVSPGGGVSTLAGSTASGSANGQGAAASFWLLNGVAVSPVDGTVFVGDSANNLIRAVTTAGLVSTLAGSATSGSATGQGD